MQLSIEELPIIFQALASLMATYAINSGMHCRLVDYTEAMSQMGNPSGLSLNQLKPDVNMSILPAQASQATPHTVRSRCRRR